MLMIRSRQDHARNPGRLCHSHHDHELLLMESGSGHQLIGEHSLPCSTGDLFLFPAGILHNSHCRSEERFVCLMAFLDERDLLDGSPGDGGQALFAQLRRRLPRGGRLICTSATRNRVRRLMQQAWIEQQQRDSAAPVAARMAITEALVALVRDDRGGERPEAVLNETLAGDQHITRAVSYIQNHGYTGITIADLLALGRLGRSTFLARFKQQTGQTVSEAIIARRVAIACELIRTTDRHLHEIALASGFYDPSHFTRQFRRITGQTPRQWREAPSSRTD